MRALRVLRRAFSADRSRHFPALKNTMLPPDTFRGRTALVTGGGTGLGRGVTSVLAQLGANVVICSRNQSVLDRTAAELNAELGKEQVLPLSTDVRDIQSVAKMLDTAELKFGASPSLVVNNAAGNFISPTERLSANAFATIVNIVLLGTANTTLECARRLIAKKESGTFLNVTTIYAESGSGYVVPSACAKAGVEAMTKSLAAEWGKYGLRFTAIQPGPIKTKGAFSRLDPTGAYEKDTVDRIPVGRLGEIEEFGNLASYMLSNFASWMNGSVVRFDGGEYSALAGEFNVLNSVTPQQWDMIESLIRKTKGS